jgi:predicted membrane protein
MEPLYQNLYEALGSVQGYIFPNEIDLQWGILIVVYPFITGLVAGAFILASLESLPCLLLSLFCLLQRCRLSVIFRNPSGPMK